MCFYFHGCFFWSLTLAAQSLEKEVQDVKATLQTMLAQLKGEEEEEELRDDDLMKNGTEEEEEEKDEDEDQYFSDSWDIWNGEPLGGSLKGWPRLLLLYSLAGRALNPPLCYCWRFPRQPLCDTSSVCG